jgi:hypothetical protein
MPSLSPTQPKYALYLNGVFDAVLKEIGAAQATDQKRECLLQPYSSGTIRLLADTLVSKSNPVRLYISTSELLPMVSYRALVVRWEDKRRLPANRLRRLNRHLRRFQPDEGRVYLEVDGKVCVNLLTITRLERVSPFSVSTLIKRDGSPLQPRTRSGGWVPVVEYPEWVGTLPIAGTRERLDAGFRDGVAQSLRDSPGERRKRLKRAAQLPERVQVLSFAFRRNPDVAAEVLARARGRCERCLRNAPFQRKSDETPYLEVHHRIFLALGGEDTVNNAVALCANCHRELHFGPDTP